MVGVLVATQALPVSVNEIMRHGEKRRGFIESEGSVGLWGRVTGRGGEEADETLQQVGHFGLPGCLRSGLFGFHIPLSGTAWGGFRQTLWFWHPKRIVIGGRAYLQGGASPSDLAPDLTTRCLRWSSPLLFNDPFDITQELCLDFDEHRLSLLGPLMLLICFSIELDTNGAILLTQEGGLVGSRCAASCWWLAAQ